MQTLIPNPVYDYVFELFNQSGNNFKKSAIIMFVHRNQFLGVNTDGIHHTAKNGEHPLSEAGIEAGKNYTKSLQK